MVPSAVSTPVQSPPPEQRDHHRLASLRTGALEFLPVPFLDEWLIKRQRREVVAGILQRRGISYDRGVPAAIAGGGRSLFARLGSLTRGLFLKPLLRLFRTVFIWISARNAARTAMTTYFLARFLHHPDLAPGGRRPYLTRARARQLADLFRRVAADIDVHAAKSALKKLALLFGRKHQTSADEVAESIEDAAPGFIAAFDAKVDRGLAALDHPA